MCGGYNRGIARARGERLLLSHDDVVMLSPGDFAQRIDAYFEGFDLFGVAGTTRLIGPTWSNAAPPYVFGQIAEDHGPPTGIRVHLFGLPAPRTAGAQALDGVLMGATRAACDAVPFDAQTFTGWHLYDLDFSYRAHLAGFRCGIVCDLHLLHHHWSDRSVFTSPAFQQAALAFYNKHKFTLPPVPAKWRPWSMSWVAAEGRDDALAIMRGLTRACGGNG